MQVLRSFSNQEVLDLQENLGRGGEACVYTVPSNENLVAKIYHHPTPNHIQKLRAMIANPPANPAASFGHISIAWPQELLTAAESSDTIIGFLMPRIRNMRPIMDFYNPGNRRQNCPLFNYQYLLRTARNLAAAFAALHASNYCIGDVNESNILVSNTALVSLVDTDSFQVPDLSQNTVYRCLVGKPEYTPPELQNKTFADYNRETYHDLFGLGVLIFQLLMEGTHPFSGVFQGLGDPPTYESRILAGHFTYSQKQKVPYLPTPITPSWQTLHPDLRDLFISCFEDGYHAPYLRPSAQTWLSVLSTAEASLVSCAVNPQHVYHPHLDKCPWCERTIKLGGRDPFPSLQAISAREHLQPRRKSRKRPRYQPRVRKPAVPLLAPYTQSSLRSTLPGYPTVQTSSRSKFYTFMFGILGLGVLGYLDIMVKFTRPFLSPNPYTQQSLLSSSSENVHSPLSLSFNDYYQRGNQAYQQQDYQQAIEDFSQGIKQNTNFSKLYMHRGNARYNLNDYEGALTDYNLALKINPQEVKALINRGNAYIKLAEYSNDPDYEYKKAIDSFNNAININQQDDEAYVRRGIVRSQIARYSNNSQEEYERSIGDFTQAIKLNRFKAEAYFQRGLARYQFAQYSSNYAQIYKQAIADFDQALNINPEMAEVFLKRGMIYYELAQYGEKTARNNQQRALEDLEKSAQLYLNKKDVNNYQQAISNICVIAEEKCDYFLQNSSIIYSVNP
ncbi:tetratricopeptide repeat protein [Cylindrospermopsis raciborskii]|uniref:tetratricopeptide repeat protein n=1 Tax=Cylindrospermopsis raciborskii TaxID=77022 RepID=UPI0008DD3CF1|nr:tetratricopeptide repeat protein [Cylindrospermopsis raciborskii]NLQ06025.1 tetratricopeptide repeat protein [Cylindrospermopsis raciborskii MVCC19]OHY32339.1 hypothetical protein BCV64_12765 [Cylindrospermopsis raciborskii MVCC14]